MSGKNTITFGFPEPEVLSSLGRLVIMQGQLEYILKMTFKSLKGISIEEALHHTTNNTGKILRTKVETLAKEKLIEGEALQEILDLIDRSWKAATARNQYVHNVWGRLNFDQLMLQNDDLSWRPAPTKQEIDDLTREISNILVLLNDSRLFGKLSEALNDNL